MGGGGLPAQPIQRQPGPPSQLTSPSSLPQQVISYVFTEKERIGQRYSHRENRAEGYALQKPIKKHDTVDSFSVRCDP